MVLAKETEMENSIMIVVLTLLVGTQDYMEAGIPLIEHAIAGEVNPFAFLWKMVFTSPIIGAGFKGGQIVPSFAIGACFGCLFGSFIEISSSMCAAVGMIVLQSSFLSFCSSFSHTDFFST